jgi:formiminoglutamase
LLDAGDLCPEGDALEVAQAKLAQEIRGLYQARLRPVILGGGHETAWASYWGLRQALGPKPRLGILNVDAHFDLRQPSPIANSGTPFFQAAQWCKEHEGTFAYCCLGIQEMSNPASLFATAESLGVQWVSAAQIQQEAASRWEAQVDAFVAAQDWVYLTLDLDAFAAPFAPGVSAPSVLGLDPRRMLPMLERIAASGKLALLDICELNPGLDQDQRTAKLGAALAWTVVRHWV